MKRRAFRSLSNLYLRLLPMAIFALLGVAAEGFAAQGGEPVGVPILAYHRFGPVEADSMTVTTPVFASHLEAIRHNGYTVVPLRRVVESFLGQATALPSRSVVLTVDDGHRSVYSELLPIVKHDRIPVTLFIYPSAISNADYAMTWDQLRELRETGLFDIQSHTYWHPNFKKEKKRLSPDEYGQFVRRQLNKSRETLAGKLGGRVDLLSWPFGIYDDELLRMAGEAGYVAAFSIDRRHSISSDSIRALPRYLMTNGVSGRAFERLLDGLAADPNPTIKKGVALR